MNEPSEFIKAIIEEYQKDGGLVGEERNIAKLFITAISKDLLTDYRIHGIIISQSSAGKSTLAKTITEPFKDDVRHYTRFTGAGLDRNEESLDGKILFYEQMEGYEPTQLKLLLSEGELSILVVDTDDQGRRKSENIKIKGMPTFITTSTNPTLDQELQNRTLIISLDESESQTKRIMEKHAQNYSKIHETKLSKWFHIDNLIEEFQQLNLSRTLKKIIIPFASDLPNDFPSHLEMRRDFDRILRLTSIIASLKSASERGYYEASKVKGVSAKIIIAYPEDYYDAIYCMGENLLDAIYRITGKAKEVYNLLLGTIKEGTLFEEPLAITTKDGAKKLGFSQKTFYKYAEYLVDRGFATKEKQGNNNFYQVVRDKTKDLDVNDLSSFNTEKWKEENLKDLKYVGRTSKEAKTEISASDIKESLISAPNIQDSGDTETLPKNKIEEYV